MADKVNDTLTRYQETRREVVHLINRLRYALSAEYIQLRMEPPAELTNPVISPVDARVEALDLGFVIMEDNTRYRVADLKNPKRAAERLRAELRAEIERRYNVLQDQA